MSDEIDLADLHRRLDSLDRRFRRLAEACDTLVSWIERKPKLWGPPKDIMNRIKLALKMAMDA